MADPRTLLSFHQVNILKELSSSSQNILAAFASLRPIRKGETLFCQGEPSPYCFGILSGEITLLSSTPAGKSAPQIYGAGYFLGGLSLLQEMPRLGLASVSQDGELLSIWSSRFRTWKPGSLEKAVILQDIQQALKSAPAP